MKMFRNFVIVFFVFILGFLFVFSSCGERVKSKSELFTLFPETLEDGWQLHGKPMVPPSVGRGYMHAFYYKNADYCKIKVWVVDKINHTEGLLWLERLMNGNHTEKTIYPFPATNLKIESFYKGFRESGKELNNNKVYEYLITGDSEYIYYVMYTVQGRYVIGIETLGCKIVSVEEARYELWPLVEQFASQ